MYSYGSPHMAAQKQDDQLERTFSSYVRIQDVVLKTYLGRWMIGRSGERGSGISVLPGWYDDDDDIYIYSTWSYLWPRVPIRDTACWLREKGWICHVTPIEAGCRGFLGHLVISFLSKLGITGRSLKVASNRLQTTARYASSWIWSKERSF